MYLSDLLSALNKNERPELSKPEIANIFQKQKHVTVYQRIALFHKLGLRLPCSKETQEEVAAKVGVSRSYIKQYDAAIGKLDDSFLSSILDAFCAGELWDGKRKLEIAGLNKKLTEGYQLRGVERKGDRWYIQWKSPEMAEADLLNRTFGSPG